MNILIRLENKNDYAEIENLTREAFWDIYQPRCGGALKTSSFDPTLDFVAVQDDRTVGNIMYSKAKVVDMKDTRMK